MGSGRYLTEAGRGVDAEALAPLRALDTRPEAYWELADALTGVGVAAAAAVAAGGLEGRTVALEGFDSAGPAIAAGLGQQGARVVAVSTAEGTAVGPGFDPDALAALWPAHGPKLVAELVGAGSTVTDPAAVFGVDADVVVTGSRPGVINDDLAGGVAARVVVPSGPTPVTAKALARLRRADKVVVPDFVSTAGPMFAGWPAPGPGGPAEPTRAAADGRFVPRWSRSSTTRTVRCWPPATGPRPTWPPGASSSRSAGRSPDARPAPSGRRGGRLYAERA